MISSLLDFISDEHSTARDSNNSSVFVTFVVSIHTNTHAHIHPHMRAHIHTHTVKHYSMCFVITCC